MNITMQEQLAAADATRRAAMAAFLSAALHSAKTTQVAEQAVAALDIGTGPKTSDIVHILIAAARGANVQMQALDTLSRLAFQHSEYNAGV